jgi:hypothetical protein
VTGPDRARGNDCAEVLDPRPIHEAVLGFVGKKVYVSLDIGLVDIDDINDWTA